MSQELLHEYRRTRDATVLAAVISDYQAMVYNTCLRVLRNRDDAEEITQECFLLLVRKAGEINSSLGGWLHVCATTLAINRLRQDRQRRLREAEHQRYNQNIGSGPSWQQISPEIDAALAELPRESHEMIVSHFLHRQPQTQIASETGLSQATVSRRIAEGLDLLRSKLAGRGLVTSASTLGPMLLQQTPEPASEALVRELGKVALTGIGETTTSRMLRMITAVGAVAVVAAGMLLTSPKPKAPTTITSGPPAMTSSGFELEGVPRIGYDIRTCPFVGSMESCLRYMGDTPDYDYLMTVSGAAFRRLWKNDDGANVAVCYNSLDSARLAFRAAGYELQQAPAVRDRLLAAMKQSLARRHPVIGFGCLAGPPEPCVITGYEQDGAVLLGWSYFQSDKRTYCRNAEPDLSCEYGFFVFGERRAIPSARQTLLATLRCAIDFARTARRSNRPDHVAGLNAYEAWAACLENDAEFPANEPEVMETRTMVHQDQVQMVYERASAAKGLRQFAGQFPEIADDLESAADLLERVAACYPSLSSANLAEALGDRQKRVQFAVVVREAAALEEQAIGHLETALATLEASLEVVTRPEIPLVGISWDQVAK